MLERTNDTHDGSASPAEAGSTSRVSGHAVPPASIRVDYREFRGPLHAVWGDAMREQGLVSAFQEADASDLRGRLGLPSSSDRDAWRAMDATTLSAVREAARAERGTPWPALPATLFARYVRDGNRRTYEDSLFARQERLSRAVVAAASADDNDPDARGWLDEAADGAVLLCEQSTWSLPAHDDAHARRGFVIPDAASPYLDLWAGEIVAQLAVADHVLGARWDATWPGVRERIRHEAEHRVFIPFETRDDLWWLGYWRDVNNWNPWIIGNVLLAAVLLLDDDERLARLMARGLESLDRYVATLPADGAIDEGVAYWWNGAARMLECLELVARVTNGLLDAGHVPVVTEVLRFPMRMQLGSSAAGDWYVNVADGWARSSGEQPWQVPFRWGARLGDERVVAWASGGKRPGEPLAYASGGLPRLLRALSDTTWRDASAAASPLPALVWLPSVQVLVCRARGGEQRGLVLAAKGGTNDENHNHKDLGSFIVAAGGRPLLVDVGKPTYTRQTFSAGRYGIRAMQSGWHNAPAPHGLEQSEGPEFAASVLRAPLGGEPGTARAESELPVELELELTGAYPPRHGERWLRTFRLASERRVEIVDTWILTDPRDETGSDAHGTGAVHLIAAGDVHVSGAEARVTAEGRGIRITTAEGVAPTTEVWELDDQELIDVWGARLTRLTYPIEASAGSLTTIIEELAP
ncbi:heparinase II/III domain-containing protein [Rathayibacter sp. KR2-224]|uniref:heparinase II/III domain-containing protein n=1 Tax=Rathayibacter sp. KR2-224 TaxID=3400913 RepID=UPI003C07EAB1